MESTDNIVEKTYSSKLEEQATAKGDISYSFWAASAPNASAPVEPKKLTAEEIAAQAEQTKKHAESTGASAWNAGGTFEERNVFSYAKETLTELITGFSLTTSSDSTLTLKEVVTCKGEAHQWIVRGQRRAGFELELKITWQLETADGKQASGFIKIDEVSADELDEIECEIVVDETDYSKEEAKNEAEKVLPEILEHRLTELVTKIKQK